LFEIAAVHCTDLNLQQAAPAIFRVERQRASSDRSRIG